MGWRSTRSSEDPGSARPGLDLRSSPCAAAGDAGGEVRLPLRLRSLYLPGARPPCRGGGYPGTSLLLFSLSRSPAAPTLDRRKGVLQSGRGSIGRGARPPSPRRPRAIHRGCRAAIAPEGDGERVGVGTAKGSDLSTALARGSRQTSRLRVDGLSLVAAPHPSPLPASGERGCGRRRHERASFVSGRGAYASTLIRPEQASKTLLSRVPGRSART